MFPILTPIGGPFSISHSDILRSTENVCVRACVRVFVRARARFY